GIVGARGSAPVREERLHHVPERIINVVRRMAQRIGFRDGAAGDIIGGSGLVPQGVTSHGLSACRIVLERAVITSFIDLGGNLPGTVILSSRRGAIWVGRLDESAQSVVLIGCRPARSVRGGNAPPGRVIARGP